VVLNQTLISHDAATSQSLFRISSCSCLRKERHAIVKDILSVAVPRKAYSSIKQPKQNTVLFLRWSKK
jgi:hypothetical protein